MMKPAHKMSRQEVKDFVDLVIAVSGFDGVQDNHLARALSEAIPEVRIDIGRRRLQKELPMPAAGDKYSSLDRLVA